MRTTPGAWERARALGAARLESRSRWASLRRDGAARLGSRRASLHRDERGSGTFVFIWFALILMLLTALVVDAGLAISEREQAAYLADQAARAEAQNLDLPTLRSKGLAVIDNDGCRQAQSFVGAAKDTVRFGTAQVDQTFGNEDGGAPDGCALPKDGPPTSVTVQVVVTYSPFVLDIFGGTVTVTETGTATAETPTSQ